MLSRAAHVCKEVGAVEDAAAFAAEVAVLAPVAALPAEEPAADSGTTESKLGNDESDAAVRTVDLAVCMLVLLSVIMFCCSQVEPVLAPAASTAQITLEATSEVHPNAVPQGPASLHSDAATPAPPAAVAVEQVDEDVLMERAAAMKPMIEERITSSLDNAYKLRLSLGLPRGFRTGSEGSTHLARASAEVLESVAPRCTPDIAALLLEEAMECRFYLSEAEGVRALDAVMKVITDAESAGKGSAELTETVCACVCGCEALQARNHAKQTVCARCDDAEAAHHEQPSERTGGGQCQRAA